MYSILINIPLIEINNKHELNNYFVPTKKSTMYLSEEDLFRFHRERIKLTSITCMYRQVWRLTNVRKKAMIFYCITKSTILHRFYGNTASHLFGFNFGTYSFSIGSWEEGVESRYLQTLGSKGGTASEVHRCRRSWRVVNIGLAYMYVCMYTGGNSSTLKWRSKWQLLVLYLSCYTSSFSPRCRPRVRRDSATRSASSFFFSLIITGGR